MSDATVLEHSHAFLGEAHEKSERRTWAVIWLCAAMLVAEIVGGLLFGSIALVADGLHMSTHAGALLLAALAYSYARNNADDPRFSFGTGKLGDLAGFTSAIVLALIALLIAYEAIGRFLHPVPIAFAEALPIAGLGLAVNVASVWLLGGGHDHGHSQAGHSHKHPHDHGRDDHAEENLVIVGGGVFAIEIFEDDHPPVFRLRATDGQLPAATEVLVEIARPDGACETHAFEAREDFLQGVCEIAEPHAFSVDLAVGADRGTTAFEEHDHDGCGGDIHRDNNMRAAIVHVLADAAVSVLVIAGLVLARIFGWTWTDPFAGIAGAVVIATWSWSLVRATGSTLLDMNPDRNLTRRVRSALEEDGDRLADLHVWRLGPGHLGAIVSVRTAERRDCGFYRAKLARFRSLSHVTVEVQSA